MSGPPVPNARRSTRSPTPCTGPLSPTLGSSAGQGCASPGSRAVHLQPPLPLVAFEAGAGQASLMLEGNSLVEQREGVLGPEVIAEQFDDETARAVGDKTAGVAGYRDAQVSHEALRIGLGIGAEGRDAVRIYLSDVHARPDLVHLR